MIPWGPSGRKGWRRTRPICQVEQRRRGLVVGSTPMGSPPSAPARPSEYHRLRQLHFCLSTPHGLLALFRHREIKQRPRGELHLKPPGKHDITVYSCYASTSAADDEKREAFYEDLEATLKKDKSFYKFVLGDLTKHWATTARDKEM